MSPIDLVILLAGIVALLVVGYVTSRQERDTRDFFLGRRGIPGWAVCLSFIATEISAVTIINVPAQAYRANWHYLQMFIGSAGARIAIAFLFIPVFYRFDCTTIYEFLRHRFGPATQYCAVALFFVTRLLGSGVRLFSAAAGTAVILGWTRLPAAHAASAFSEAAGAPSNRAGLIVALLIFTAVSIAFIAFGGIKAVIWNNVVQALVFIAGGVTAALFLLSQIDGGVAAVHRIASAAHRTEILNLSLDPHDPEILLLFVLSGFFTNLAAFGTDQDLMQRLLTVETRRKSQRSLLATIAVGLPVVTVFLSIGTLLFAFYQTHPAVPRPADAEQVLPFFIANSMPPGVKGLLLLTIIMASIDSPLGSLATSFVTDLYRPLVRGDADERHYLFVSRVAVVIFGLALGLLAFAASYLTDILWVAFQILSVTGGSLLGVFLLGLLTRRAGDLGNVIAMIANALGMTVLLVLIKRNDISLGWTWLIVIGTTFTLTLAYVLGQASTSEASTGTAGKPAGSG